MITKEPLLVIDDEESIRDSCAQALSKGGLFSVEVAGDGTKGLELLAKVKPKAVLVDLKMPGLSGMEVIKRIRETNPEVAIIVITGYATIDSAIEALKEGVSDYLTKPFTPDEVIGAVNSCIEKMKEREDAASTLKRREKLQEKFITMVSHEIRSPLNSVQQYLEAFLSGAVGQISGDQKRVVERMSSSVSGLIGLAEEWLSVSKIKSGAIPGAFQSVAMASLVAETADTLRPLAEKRNVRIEVTTGKGDALVSGDKRCLERVVSNLLDNAIRYSRKGTVVKVGLVELGSNLRLSVRDEGGGIPPDDIPYVFDEFFTSGKKNQLAPDNALYGYGMGLAIVKQITEMHGGRVQVFSRVGQGTEFVVELPRITKPPVPEAKVEISWWQRLSSSVVAGLKDPGAWAVRLLALAAAAGSIIVTQQFMGPQTTFFPVETPWMEKALLACDLLLTLYLFFQCRDIKRHEAWIPVVLLAQAAVVAYTEFVVGVLPVENPFYIDNFSLIMALIIGVVGGLICVYAIAYMKEFHEHHPQLKDKRGSFFFLFFFFLAAMFGIVVSNHLGLLFLFWEITTLCSYMLIRYTGEEEAVRNAFKALGYNLIGGLGFAVALLILAVNHQAPALDQVIALGKTGALVAVVPAVLMCFAGLTKSAQMPFSSWLLGAMVAPTPVSALLHSSTMVKAGVFIILKFAPVMHANPWVGFFLGLIGGVTFLFASLAAVTQSNAKRVLAYSTVANLGLVVACAGVGTPEATWAGILLIIFHAVAKGLLFQAVGTVEHKIGSRDIEDMDGLISSRPGLASVLLIGTLGMFLAPFGMLISKWASLQSFIQANPLLAILVAFGSAPTLFFWAKWMGKLVSATNAARVREKVSPDEWSSLGSLSILTLAACFLFPLVSWYMILPYLQSASAVLEPFTRGNLAIMAVMTGGFLVLLPILKLIPRKETRVAAYLAGSNVKNGNTQFQGAIGKVMGVEMRNYYLTSLFTEKGLAWVGGILCVALSLAMLWAALVNPHWGAPAVLAAVPGNALSLAQKLFALVAFLVGAPLLGGLLAGLDRILTARLQGRVGPPILQPFYDVLKLMEKRTVVVNHTQAFYVSCFLLFVVMSGALFFIGGDLLLVVFSLTVGSIFLALAAYSPNSPYSNVGAERELLQMMAYEPMLLLTVLGMYLVTKSFNVSSMVGASQPMLYMLPGIFLGFLFILTIKLRKSPFDLSTSHHGHQELVKGLTTEFSGSQLALIEVGHWYENVLLLGLVYLFFASFSPVIALAATLAVFLFEILIDNTYARLTWKFTLKSSWAVAVVLGVVNLLALYYWR